MSGRGLEALLAACRWPRPRALHVAADRVVAALEAVVADQILMDPRRQKPRRGRQPLIDQRLELVQLARHPLAPVDRLGAGLQIALDRPPVAPEQPADLGVRVALAGQRPHVHQFLLADHQRPPSLDDTKAASVMATADRTADPGTRSGRAHARDGLVAPPGLLT